MAIRLRQYANRKSYQAVVYINDRRITKNFDRKSDAERWERSKLESRDSGDLASIPQISLAEFKEEWFGVYSTRVRPATRALTEHLLESFVLPSLGGIRIDKVGNREVNLLVADLLQNGKSTRYANMVTALIRKMFNDAAQDFGYSLKNPAAKIKRLKENPRKLEFWGKEEASSFLNTVGDRFKEHRFLFVFLLNTGCRIGECFSLQWADVDLKKKMVCIRRTVDRISHTAQETTKGNKIRYVGLNDACLEALQLARNRTIGTDRANLVFPNKAGGILHHSDFQRRVFDPAIKAAGVRKIRIHDLRHTFAAHFVMNGGSIYDLKQILGHSEIQMTERYAHLAPEYLQGRTSILNFR